MRRTTPLRWLVLSAALVMLASPSLAEARAWLGVYTQEVTGELRDALDLDGDGALVSSVVPDGPADRAARKGFALAKRLEADVALVFVGHPKTGELVLPDTVATMADEEGVTVRTTIREGEAAHEIIAEASEGGFDLVVVGNRGLAGAKAVLIGSVPLTVAEECGTDVLIARTIARSPTNC